MTYLDEDIDLIEKLIPELQEKRFYELYKELDEDLTLQLAPFSHKKAYTDPKNLATLAAQKITPSISAAITALYFADDFINDLAELDDVSRIRTEIRSDAKAARGEILAGKVTAEVRIEETEMRLKARMLVTMVRKFLAGSLFPSEELVLKIRKVQNTYNRDNKAELAAIKLPEPSRRPRALPNTRGGSAGPDARV